jgi:nicotinamidase-related amidase
MLRLTGRYFRTIPIDKTGYETELVELDPAHTAFIGMHCWDIGCEGGPNIDANFCVGMGYYETFREAERIMKECIRPAMDAARKARVLVCHVESPTIGVKHPEAQQDLDPVSAPSKPQPPVVPGWREHITARSHGKDYPARSPYARMDRAKIVAPQPGEPFVYQTGQFDRILRRQGIQNLIYSGFATDMCILRSPGGIEPMAPLGYRIFLMRDATVGVECPDTFAERLATRWAIRYFETHYGDTITSDDFLRACENCGQQAGRRGLP